MNRPLQQINCYDGTENETVTMCKFEGEKITWVTITQFDNKIVTTSKVIEQIYKEIKKMKNER